MARRVSWVEGMEIAERSAWTHFGHRHWKWFVYGRFAGKALAFMGVLGGLALAWYWLWFRLPHPILGAACLVLGGIPLALFAVRRFSSMGLQARLMARASGRVRAPAAAWALVGFMVAMFGAGFVALWSPWA